MRDNEYTRQANDFLKRANATCKIEYAGAAINTMWDDTQVRSLYFVTLKTSKGEMQIKFWDSIHNTEIQNMSPRRYAAKLFKRLPEDLSYMDVKKAGALLEKKQAEAVPTAYDVLSCLIKYDVGTFEDFCCEFGYDTDSRRAEQIYFACQKEYAQLQEIFTQQQLEELQEIN